MKAKKPRNNMSSNFKKAGMPEGVRRKGNWELEREKNKVPGKPKTREGKMPLQLSTAVKMEMARDKASGMSDPGLARKYSVSVTYAREALLDLHMKSGKAREILKDVLFTNAIACGMQARKQMDELTPMQSVIATGIFTQRAIDMDKHTAGMASDVDFSQLNEVGNLLRDLRGNKTLPSDLDGDIIDIDPAGEGD